MSMTTYYLKVHVIEALWMEGVWSGADRIQAVQLQSPILPSTKLLGKSKKKLPTDEILADGKSMNARWRGWLFIPSYEGICVGFWRFHRVI